MENKSLRGKIVSMQEDVSGILKENRSLSGQMTSIEKSMSAIQENVGKIQGRMRVLPGFLAAVLVAGLAQAAVDNNVRPNQEYVNQLHDKGYSLEYDKPAYLVLGKGYYFKGKDGQEYRIIGFTEDAFKLTRSDGLFKNTTVDVPRR